MSPLCPDTDDPDGEGNADPVASSSVGLMNGLWVLSMRFCFPADGRLICAVCVTEVPVLLSASLSLSSESLRTWVLPLLPPPARGDGVLCPPVAVVFVVFFFASAIRR